MGLFTKDIKSKRDLFEHTLKDIWYAENKILKALPKMIEKTTSESLREAFEHHLDETEGQVERLRQVFAYISVEPEGVKCEAIDGIIEEAESIMKEVDDDEVLDAAILASAQAVEHYEITRYGTLATWAREMGLGDCAQLLHQTLEEEKSADEKLSSLAESRINERAA
jgi:ferritin-like metal-binding protein YciE